MFLSKEFVQHLEQSIRLFSPLDYQIKHYIPVSGGDINQCFQLQTAERRYFMKMNDAHKLPNLFVVEKEGLTLLRNTGNAFVPNVHAIGQFGQYAYLLLTWQQQHAKTAKAEAKAGEMLALIHQNSTANFGLSYDNYLGFMLQSNKQHDNWSTFFINERLKPQLAIAQQANTLSLKTINDFEKLFRRLPDLYQPEPPALLHGDLWNGNVLYLQNDQPCLIDPACYYGHREMDIALTLLFGGFSDSFYDAYQAHFPLQSGWQERTELWNLYILLFHANAFGGNYPKQVVVNLRKYL